MLKKYRFSSLVLLFTSLSMPAYAWDWNPFDSDTDKSVKKQKARPAASQQQEVITRSQTAFVPQDKRWYVAPSGSLVKSGGAQDGDDGWAGRLAIGKMLNRHFNIEFKGFYEGYGDGYPPMTGNIRQDLTGASADLQYFFTRNIFAPYTVIGFGGMTGGVDAGSDTFLTSEAGAGFTYEFTDNFLFRSDVRYRYGHNFDVPENIDTFHDMTVNVGFVVPFGPKPRAVVQRAVEPPPAPIPQPQIPHCSTLDTDQDGVNDCLDQCPATLPNSRVNARGCPVSMELKGVFFEYDSAKLTPNALIVLDTVAQNLIKYPQDKDIEVHGHTSSEGSDAYNLKLSQKRSQSVVNYLKQKGVPNKLYARGLGETMPIADNATEEGRSRNRRVELIWLGR